jgi:hypothetical protein
VAAQHDHQQQVDGHVAFAAVALLPAACHAQLDQRLHTFGTQPLGVARETLRHEPGETELALTLARDAQNIQLSIADD